MELSDRHFTILAKHTNVPKLMCFAIRKIVLHSSIDNSNG